MHLNHGLDWTGLDWAGMDGMGWAGLQVLECACFSLVLALFSFIP